MSVDGELERVGETWRLRFTRHLDHPASDVWQALTDPERLRAWFPDRMVGQITQGAKLRFETGIPGIADFAGEVLAFDPPTLLEFRWGTDTLRFEIHPDGDACMLVFLDTIDALGKAARDGAGWHECLDRLEHELDATPVQFKQGERWGEVHPGYVEKFGPAAASIGPPKGALPDTAS